MPQFPKTPAARVARFLITLASVGVAAWLALAIIAALLIPHTVTDVDQYERLLDDWSPTGLTAHFPPTIPPGIRQARLSSFPGFLQGGGHLQLYTLVCPKDAAAADKKFASLATHTLRFDETNDPPDEPTDTWPIIFRTNATDSHRFDPSFTIYVLSPEGAKALAPRNHGKCCGVAVSTQHNEIVYWAESW